MQKYINRHAGTTKSSIKIILVQLYNIIGLVIGVPDYSSDVIEKNVIGFIVTISQSGVCKS